MVARGRSGTGFRDFFVLVVASGDAEVYEITLPLRTRRVLAISASEGTGLIEARDDSGTYLFECGRVRGPGTPIMTINEHVAEIDEGTSLPVRYTGPDGGQATGSPATTRIAIHPGFVRPCS